ncbi:hypothetical protein [Paraliobacillus sp. JSM ZJ581]|uniref:hypothetical protein n=1 Tax=Paraliobacillus sp. JSM ZJ581 TaxID=3342118 RepID=UPI0035A8A2C9
MPAISKIRLANVIYEEGNKRYNDELFLFDGYNSAILLENGGGKTVLIQTALQAMLPHAELAGRKIGKTLTLENAPAHIAVEWIINDKPRRYVVTAVTLFMNKHGVDSLRYVYEYQHGDAQSIEEIPFVRDVQGGKRPAEKGEMQDYYSVMKDRSFSASTFTTIKDYRQYIEENYQIIASEWENIVKINSSEGGVEAFFEACKTTNQLFDRLLIPTVESAMSGYDKSNFAELFQNRYESFKRYQQLTETLDENKQIQEALTNYTETYELLHAKEQQLYEVKQQAKGIWEQTKQQANSFVVEKESVVSKIKDWELKQHYHQVKRDSSKLAAKEVQKQQIEQKYQQASVQLKEQEVSVSEIGERHASLRYAKFNKERKEAKQTLAFIQEQITSFEEETDMDGLKEQLEEVEQALHGAYQTQIEQIEKVRKQLQFEKNPLEEQLKNLEEQRMTLQQTYQQHHDKIIQVESVIVNRKQDSANIRQSLLANPNQEKVEEQLPTWEARYQQLDDELVQLKTQSKRIERETEQKEQERTLWQTEMQDKALQLQRVEQHLVNINEEEQHLIQSLAMLRSAWKDVTGIYPNQQSIEGQLENNIEKQRIERVKWLDKERVSLRYVDDYGKQETFFSDPFLSEQIERWKEQLDYVETGVNYLNQLPEAQQTLLKRNRLWPSLLVTTAKSKDRLMERLEQVSDRFMFPVKIVTTEEATVVTDEDNGDWIVPEHWRSNLASNQFLTWQQQLKQQAKEITVRRENTEKTLHSWETALDQFRTFVKKYPFDQLVAWQEEQYHLQTELENITTKLQQVDKQIIDNKTTIVKHNRRAQEASAERMGIEAKLRESQLYLTYQKEIAKSKLEIDKHLEHQQELDRKMKQTLRSTTRYQEEIEVINDRMRGFEFERELILNDSNFLDVMELPVIYTDESVSILLEKRRELQMQKDKMSRAIGEWEQKEITEKNTIQTATERMDEIEQAIPSVDKEQLFPADGDQYIERLHIQLKKVKDELTEIRETYHALSQNFHTKTALLNADYHAFNKKYPDNSIVQFEQADLAIVNEQLQKEKIDLDEQKNYLDQELERVNKELASIEEAKNHLSMFIEAYHFNAPDIVAIALTEQEAIDFQYNRYGFAKRATNKLKEVKQLVDVEVEHVQQAKDKFRIFCRTRITDKKLQQMAIQGVEQKRDYQDVITFKQNMLASIQRISKYANEHIRKNDEELQVFIEQIHTHLQTLVEELEQIPKKTRVKVDNWKPIYSFSIPKWEDEDGKLRIRNHTEWIMKQLDNDKYWNDQGHQDMNKIRADLEKWLESKQLLKVVMDRDVMKVHCRKVMNDNQISTRSYSWEHTNVWSGGEKWSKNMTLFLGILKYVAEKKKSNLTDRAVILDNPFGKASSEHVLSPVFFIAEQLGFQMIALTAHAEGKFLQDYFPIIYSCRLRGTQEGNKKVMSTNKWLHHAYFQDHEPAVIDRLGQTEQLDLFQK